MEALFVLFILSFIGLTILFWHKVMELKRGTTLISSDIRSRADAVVESKIYQQKDVLVRKGKHAVRAFFVGVQKAFRTAFISGLHHIHEWLTRFLEKMKGRSSVRKQRGSVSFFLQNVAEHKEEMKAERPSGDDMKGL